MYVFSPRKTGIYVGILILAAYAMLTYSVTGNKPLGVVTDLIAGLAVIAIPFLMRPLFAPAHPGLNAAYMAARFIEGALMLAGGALLMTPAGAPLRNQIYESVQVWFFIAGALLFYLLLYQTRAVPRFISVWGGLAAAGLLLVTLASLFGVNLLVLNLLVLPMILNEVFLAIWLMAKGFTPPEG